MTEPDDRASAGDSAMKALRIVATVLLFSPLLATAARLSAAEIAATCANAEGTAHCGRLIESVQLNRLPGLARREGEKLIVSLYPMGTATFLDVDDPVKGRSYSLWDSLDPINAVVLYTTTSQATLFTLLQRTTNRRFEFPAEPLLSPDRQRLVTADICAKGCSGEIAVWRISKEDVRKELAWVPGSIWSDAAATWKNGDTLTIEYTPVGQQGDASFERRLSDPSWTRLLAP
jgi:hypothetical protein